MSPLALDQGPIGAVPTVLRLFDPLNTGKDDLGRELSSEHPYADYAIPRSAMGKSDTPQAFVWASQMLNKAGGGDGKYYPPQLFTSVTNRSPEDLQYIVETAGGGIGKQGVKSWNFLEGLIAGDYKSIGEGIAAAPIVSSFGGTVKRERAISAEYYEAADEMARSAQMVRDRVKETADDKEGEAAKVVKARGELADGIEFNRQARDGDVMLSAAEGSAYEAYVRAKKKVDSLNQRIKALHGTDLTMTERRKQIRALQAERADAQAEFVTAFRKARSAHRAGSR
jgi:hypothetical protein